MLNQCITFKRILCFSYRWAKACNRAACVCMRVFVCMCLHLRVRRCIRCTNQIPPCKTFRRKK